MRKRRAGPLADTTPALDAIMARDLRSRRKSPEIGKRKRKRIFDQATYAYSPVPEAARNVALVVRAARIERAVGAKCGRDVGFRELARKCVATREETLGATREHFDLTEDVEHPRLLREIVAARKHQGGRACRCARKESASIVLVGFSHVWSPHARWRIAR